MGFKTFNTARRTLSGIEAMNMIRKGRVNGIDQGGIVSQVRFIEAIFGAAAQDDGININRLSSNNFCDTTQSSDLNKAPDNLLHPFYRWCNSGHIVPINIFLSMHLWRVVQDVGEAFFFLSTDS